jgi:hypothetical protein
MFVAALGHDEATDPRPAACGGDAARAVAKPDAESLLCARAFQAPMPGVLLANALGYGFQPSAS